MSKLRVPFPPQRQVLSNGTQVLLVPRPGLQRKMALWTVPFGSLNQSAYTAIGEQLLPAGMAHFLEHQLFREEDGSSISDRFAALGVQENAFTYFDQTGYHFSGAGHFEEALQLLLRFTAQPSFTVESVENERDIITQELLMYRDIPESVLELNLRRALFGDHPAGEDIGGTPQSIALVTPELLQLCHDQYYHPSRAVLIVVGDLQMEEIVHLAETVYADLPQPGEKPRQLLLPVASGEPVQQEKRSQMSLSRPLVSIGFKEEQPLQDGRLSLLRQLESDLLCSLLLGKSSPSYWQLYQRGLINSTFSADYQSGPHFAYARIGSECDNPDALVAALQEILFREQPGLEEVALTRLKKKTLGEFVAGFEGFDSLAFDLSSAEFAGSDLLLIPELLDRISIDSLRQRAQDLLRPEQMAVSIVYP